MVCQLKVPAPFFAKFVERGVPVDGVGIGKLLLEITKGATGCYEQWNYGFDVFQSNVWIIDESGETVKGDTEENDFLVDVNTAGFFVEGLDLLRFNVAAIVTMLDGVLVSFFASGATSMGSTAGWAGAADGPGFAGLAFGGIRGAFGEFGGHIIWSWLLWGQQKSKN